MGRWISCLTLTTASSDTFKWISTTVRRRKPFPPLRFAPEGHPQGTCMKRLFAEFGDHALLVARYHYVMEELKRLIAEDTFSLGECMMLKGWERAQADVIRAIVGDCILGSSHLRRRTEAGRRAAGVLAVRGEAADNPASGAGRRRAAGRHHLFDVQGKNAGPPLSRLPHRTWTTCRFLRGVVAGGGFHVHRRNALPEDLD